MQPFSGNQRPDLLTALMNMSLVLRLPRKMHLCRSSSNASRLPWFLDMVQNLHVLLTFDKVNNPLKVLRTPSIFCTFDFEMCFAPQRRALFRHLNFQKWSEPGVFCTFDFGTCFAPQRRALFRHLNFQKWSEPGVFCTFDFGTCFAPQWRALFDIAPSKSGPNVKCSYLFHSQMRFAPQQRALFRQRNS